jgi:uncharacterized membrane protein
MDATAVTLSAPWAIAAWVLAAPLLLGAVWAAPWRRLGDSEQAHVWYGGIFCLVALWSLRATVGDGYTFHLLGVTAFTLMTGPALAFAGSALAVALLIAVSGGLWLNGGIAYLAMAALPVGVSWLVLRLAERRLPPNFFIYVFVAAFFGAALAYGAAGLAGATLLTSAAGMPAGRVFGEYVPYLLYLAFGDATLSGMILTLAVVYRPRWVATFDDGRYLTGR